MVSESWFIGAFGKWWRGGPIQAWWVDSVVNAKDTERCSSGVLDMKPLDGLECYDGELLFLRPQDLCSLNDLRSV